MSRQVLQNFCAWQSTTAGLGDFTVGAAIAADDSGSHGTMQDAGAQDGQTYRYYAQTPDGSETQLGLGVYHSATGTLTRVKVFGNSDGTTDEHDFAVAPIVDVFPKPKPYIDDKSGDRFPTGTLMLFQQTAAPTGWTKQTTHNDKTLRVVSGTAGSGGSSAFSSVFSYRTSDGHTLTIAEMPYHTHPYTDEYTHGAPGANTEVQFGSNYDVHADSLTTGGTGGGGSHTHTYDMRVQYVDLIIASKN